MEQLELEFEPSSPATYRVEVWRNNDLVYRSFLLESWVEAGIYRHRVLATQFPQIEWETESRPTGWYGLSGTDVYHAVVRGL